MKLFTIDDNNEVLVNAAWIKLIPEFKAVFTHFGGRPDRPGKATKVLAYIYFILDFSSPLKTWNDEDKKKEALRYCSITEEDVKLPVVKKALTYYEELQYECCRPLKTYRSAQKAMESMDTFLENVDFDARDKQGKLLFTPTQYADMMAKVNKVYDEIYKLEKRVETELEQNAGIRGKKSVMSDREIRYANTKGSVGDSSWDETTGDVPTGPNYVDIADLLKPKDESKPQD